MISYVTRVERKTEVTDNRPLIRDRISNGDNNFILIQTSSYRASVDLRPVICLSFFLMREEGCRLASKPPFADGTYRRRYQRERTADAEAMECEVFQLIDESKEAQASLYASDAAETPTRSPGRALSNIIRRNPPITLAYLCC